MLDKAFKQDHYPFKLIHRVRQKDFVRVSKSCFFFALDDALEKILLSV